MVDSKNIDFDFSGHVVNVEDAENSDTEITNPISDNELESAGLIKTSAFIRSKKSKNALRVKKHKDKKAQDGIKQVNVEVPEHQKEAIKILAKELCKGGDFKKALLTQDSSGFQKLLIKLFF